MKKTFKMKEKVFIYPSEYASWHFIPVTKKVGQEIKKNYGINSRGFGSLPVESRDWFVGLEDIYIS